MMNDRLKRLFARLSLEVGVNLQKNQCLIINCGIANYEYARIITDEAYRMGARYVSINILDNELLRSRISHSSWENLKYVPRNIIERAHMEIDEDWARIRIENVEEQRILKDVPATSLREVMSNTGSALTFLREALMRHRHSWLVISVPGPNWAREVYNLSENASADELQRAFEKLEKVFIEILRLDKDDPVTTWKELGTILRERSKKLNSLGLDSLRFSSDKTDLLVGLAQDHIWCGGPERLPDGRWHEPNLPSEEVFTVPDFRRTEGFVQVLRKTSVMENTVEDAWFQFKEGQVVDFGARKGADILKQFFAFDEGARYLGEVALVDIDSPINRSGLVFNNILFDENASCHIAFGAGYPINLRRSSELKTDHDLREAGCNVSIVHKDFMISNAQTNVFGQRSDGSEIPIMQQGRFVI